MKLLEGKGAVVTGAASGIGKAIATAFIEAGAGVLLCDLNARALDGTACELGDRAIGRVTDVSDESQVEGALREARAAFAHSLQQRWEEDAGPQREAVAQLLASKRLATPKAGKRSRRPPAR